MWNSLKLILIGGLIGWVAHSVISKEAVFTVVSDTPINSSMQKLSKDNIGSGSQENSGLINLDTIPATDPGDFHYEKRIHQLLLSGNFHQAISFCLSFRNKKKESCRSVVINYARSEESSIADTLLLLDVWLAEHPQDIEATLIRVREDVAKEQFLEAANRLAFLNSYQVDADDIDRVAREVQKFARGAIINLTIKSDIEQLRRLLATLIEIEPTRSAWRYSLAKAESDIEDYESALSTLAYILYDTEYGDRAAYLYDSVLQKVNLANYFEVPLRKIGHQYQVKVQINQFYEATLILDTGASMTVLDSNIIEALGLSPNLGKDVVFDTVGGRVTAKLLRINAFGVGGEVLRNFEVATMTMPGLENSGLLGVNFLDQFRFVIDEKQRKLYLSRK